MKYYSQLILMNSFSLPIFLAMNCKSVGFNAILVWMQFKGRLFASEYFKLCSDRLLFYELMFYTNYIHLLMLSVCIREFNLRFNKNGRNMLFFFIHINIFGVRFLYSLHLLIKNFIWIMVKCTKKSINLTLKAPKFIWTLLPENQCLVIAITNY